MLVDLFPTSRGSFIFSFYVLEKNETATADGDEIRWWQNQMIVSTWNIKKSLIKVSKVATDDLVIDAYFTY